MISFILNFPYTIAGLLVGLFSSAKNMKFNKKPVAFVLNVKKFWWVFGYMRHARAMTIGNVIFLGPNIEDKDLEHELVHVEQHQRAPLVYPVLYYLEFIKKGYRDNKYEEEAYQRAGNVYKEL